MKNRLKTWWRHIPLAVRKPLVFILGFLIVILGIILLPLPGPGWAIIFLGFAILATEFEPAERVRDFLVRILKLLIEFGLKMLKEPWRNPLLP